MPADVVHEVLDRHGIAYDRRTHPRAVTAQELAALEHVSGWQVAKPVLLWVSGELAMAVVPAAMEVDLDKCGAFLGHNQVRLATEEEFGDVFTDCELGAEPPFGNLYGVPVFLDERLRAQRQIVYRDGTHTTSIWMALTDYLAIVDPEIADLSRVPTHL